MTVYLNDIEFIMPGVSSLSGLFAAIADHQTAFSLSPCGHLCGAVTEVGSEEGVDRVVTLASTCAKRSGWKLDENTGVFIGSSRGATGALETAVNEFSKHGEVSPQTSPKTTLGLISATVAKELGLCGLDMTHSSTCSTALMSLINGAAWCEAGYLENVVTGASEAPLTPFGFAQMEALRIYSKIDRGNFPSRPFGGDQNSFVLAEGAGLILLGNKKSSTTLARLASFGTCVDKAPSRTGVSAEGNNFVSTMTTALKKYGKSVDLVVCHATGTVKGDKAELSALRRVFGTELPTVIATKWLHGHSFAASGVLGIASALSLLGKDNIDCAYPYPSEIINAPVTSLKRVRSVLVNSSGFGGNTVSIIIELP